VALLLAVLAWTAPGPATALASADTGAADDGGVPPASAADAGHGGADGGDPAPATPADGGVADDSSAPAPPPLPEIVPLAIPPELPPLPPLPALPPLPSPPPPGPASSPPTASSVQQHLPEVQVVGTRRHAYREVEATAGTKISAPLRDIPQSIQVVDREMLDDLGIVRGTDLTKNVSGVYREGVGTDDRLVFRGFTTSEFLRDGFPDRRKLFRDTASTERVEVLKGPASVLYGRLEPGGTLNYVTKRPQFYPGASLKLRADSEGAIRPTVDLSAASPGGSLGLRVNGAYEYGENFRDFSFSDRQFGAAVLAWRPRDGTQISVEVEGLKDRRRLDPGLPQFGRGPAPVPVQRTTNEPRDELNVKDVLYGYTLEQRLGAAWQLRHALRMGHQRSRENEARAARSSTLIDGVKRSDLQEAGDPRWDGILGRQASAGTRADDQLVVQGELIGDFRLLSMPHKLLVGVDVDRFKSKRRSFRSAIIESNGINVYQPQYGSFTIPDELEQDSNADSTINTRALYVQDLVRLASQWTLLVGARFDDARSSTDDFKTGLSPSAKHNQLSPRAGIVWQPADSLSIYTSYSQSFVPVIGQTFAGELFEPTLGTQLEAGIKAEWLEGRLGGTMSAFKIKKDNVSVPDPDNTGFSLQTGQTTSDGIELDITGSPATGLRMIANASLADVRITKDTTVANIGRRPRNVPTRGGGLSLSYDLPGTRWWGGLGGRLGVHHVGERSGESNASRPPLFLPSYTRWDAGLSYRAARWRFALNVENLLDETYYVAINNNLIFPGAPLRAWVSLGYDL
jgi:iron complex outermembrane receptor protein